MDIHELAKWLCRLPYSAIEAEIKDLGDEDLIRLLDDKSRKVGDTAFTILYRNEKLDLVVDRLLDGTIHTRDGKVRATNMLSWRGKKYRRSAEAFLALLKDRSFDVVSNALWGLTFLQDEGNLPAIGEEADRRAAAGGQTYERFHKAIEAIEKHNPFIYSPYFMDAQGVWELDPVRFPGGHAP